MKLTDLILMGISAIPQGKGNDAMISPTERCVLGTALYSLGDPEKSLQTTYIYLRKNFPWVNKLVPHPEQHCNIRTILTHSFSLNDQGWTREQIVEWLKQYEPDELVEGGEHNEVSDAVSVPCDAVRV